MVDPMDRCLQTGHLSQAPLQLPCCSNADDNARHLSAQLIMLMLEYAPAQDSNRSQISWPCKQPRLSGSVLVAHRAACQAS